VGRNTHNKHLLDSGKAPKLKLQNYQKRLVLLMKKILKN